MKEEKYIRKRDFFIIKINGKQRTLNRVYFYFQPLEKQTSERGRGWRKGFSRFNSYQQIDTSTPC